MTTPSEDHFSADPSIRAELARDFVRDVLGEYYRLQRAAKDDSAVVAQLEEECTPYTEQLKTLWRADTEAIDRILREYPAIITDLRGRGR